MKTLTLKTNISLKESLPSFHYQDKDWRTKLATFKEKNLDSPVDITFEAVDTAAHHQFKHLWGDLYPAIMATGEENDIYKIHLKMKTRFNYIDCSSAEEIPKKYLKGNFSYINKAKLFDLDSIGYLIKFIRGTIIVESDGMIEGYIIGLSVMNYEQMDEYIKSVENYLMECGI